MSELKAAGAICYLKDGKKVYYVLLRSAKHGEWGPPKGHAEPDETEIETATRELFEEAGVRKGSFLPGFREAITYTVNKKGKQQSKEVVFFLCELESDEIKLSHEHSEFHMATLDEIEVLLQHEDLREIFRKAAKHIASMK
jgi:bis(5'-nucleosidyl)-tetraphosphatase